MHIKSIVAGAAIALAATVGSAYAADQFTTLAGVPAEPMNAGELAAVVGADFTFEVKGISITIPTDVPEANLRVAADRSGVISFGPTCPPNCGF